MSSTDYERHGEIEISFQSTVGGSRFLCSATIPVVEFRQMSDVFIDADFAERSDERELFIDDEEIVVVAEALDFDSYSTLTADLDGINTLLGVDLAARLAESAHSLDLDRLLSAWRERESFGHTSSPVNFFSQKSCA